MPGRRLAFGVTGLLVALVLAGDHLLRGARLPGGPASSSAAEQQTYVNARLSRTVLRSAEPDIRGLLTSLGGGTASDSLVRYGGEWFSTSVSVGPDAIPEDLVRAVSDGRAGHQRYRGADGELRLAVGVPIAAAEASYFEVFALDELDRTLDLLTRSLAFGVAGAALAAAAVGRVAAGRLVRPLGPVADAAERIADGALDTRLTDVDDPDLRRLADAFNTMAAALEARIDREARFAADVSHELRSPLTAVAAAPARRAPREPRPPRGGSDLGARVVVAIPAILVASTIIYLGGAWFTVALVVLGILCLASSSTCTPTSSRSASRASSA